MSSINIVNGYIFEFPGKLVKKDLHIIDETSKETIQINAQGFIVVPGLIDYHMHLSETTYKNAVSTDVVCPSSGVAFAVDAGTVGSNDFDVFYLDVIKKSKTCVKALINYLPEGINTKTSFFNEEDNTNKIYSLFSKYPDEIVGIKFRMPKGSFDDAFGHLLKAREIAQNVGCNLVVHMTNPPKDLNLMLSLLRAGDVFCHVYHGVGETIIDNCGKIKEGVILARENGIFFDACNGKNNFSFDVLQKAIEQNFWPDIISTDLTKTTINSAFVNSLTFIMSKYLSMGMPIEMLLKAVTYNPAKLLKLPNNYYNLEMCKDITILKIEDEKNMFLDFSNQVYWGHKSIKPVMTIKSLEIIYLA